MFLVTNSQIFWRASIFSDLSVFVEKYNAMSKIKLKSLRGKKQKQNPTFKDCT